MAWTWGDAPRARRGVITPAVLRARAAVPRVHAGHLERHLSRGSARKRTSTARRSRCSTRRAPSRAARRRAGGGRRGSRCSTRVSAAGARRRTTSRGDAVPSLPTEASRTRRARGGERRRAAAHGADAERRTTTLQPDAARRHDPLSATTTAAASSTSTGRPPHASPLRARDRRRAPRPRRPRARPRGDASAVAWLLGPGYRAARPVRPAPPAETSRAFADGASTFSGAAGRARHAPRARRRAHGAMNCGHAHGPTRSPCRHAQARPASRRGNFSNRGPSATASARPPRTNTVTVDGEPSSVPAAPFQW